MQGSGVVVEDPMLGLWASLTYDWTKIDEDTYKQRANAYGVTAIVERFGDGWGRLGLACGP